MTFWQPFLTAGEQIVENPSSYCRIKLISLLFYLSALGQPLRMATHATDWGDSLNRRQRGGKRNTMVMMFVGEVVLMLEGFLVLFLYGAGFFRSRPNPYRG